MMLTISENGYVIDQRVNLKISHTIEQGDLTHVHGIIVHQTGGPTAQSTFNSYAKKDAKGAHFLIDKDGTIYQTASIFKKTWHVGPLKSRCLEEMRCTPVEVKALKKFDPKNEHWREMQKVVPNRYPSNEDSIGIELVGQALPLSEPDPDKQTYETVTTEQNASLRWLVNALTMQFTVPQTEIFRHPVVSRKNRTEAATAQW